MADLSPAELVRLETLRMVLDSPLLVPTVMWASQSVESEQKPDPEAYLAAVVDLAEQLGEYVLDGVRPGE